MSDLVVEVEEPVEVFFCVESLAIDCPDGVCHLPDVGRYYEHHVRRIDMCLTVSRKRMA